ncbi:hypothetical protein RJ53_04335 [Methanocalculus chunghsingensis]|uniref:Thioredoxin domain-containing protein n=1 Tax=Methanocalculus chunghsingensis TaxID=156457 RepID=A0A8J7W9B8_9EURY|nr:hypothetical protein [Methanocalculus chunghsingensis]MBR1368777.1 hypothetical protein [Methanocalculus chunghsingensis]
MVGNGHGKKVYVCLVVLTLLLASGCTGFQDERATEIVSETDSIPWLTIPLTDIPTEEEFTLGSLMASGKPVIIHTFTTSCPACGAQFRESTDLQREYPDFSIVVGLNIDPGEGSATVRRYVERNGYQGLFVTAPAQLSIGLIETFGIRFMQSTPQTILLYNDTIYFLGPGVFSSEGLAAIIGDLSS